MSIRGQHLAGSAFPKQVDEAIQFFARGFLARNGAEENGQLGDEFFVFRHFAAGAAYFAPFDSVGDLEWNRSILAGFRFQIW